MPSLANAHVGITPTGWTNDDLPTVGEHISFEQCISEIALAGYEGCSIGHKYPTSASTLKKELALRNLRISEPWASTYFVVERNRNPAIELEKTQTVASFEERIKFIKQVEGDNLSPDVLPSPLPKADMVIAELSYAVHQLPLEPMSTRPEFNDTEWENLLAGLKLLAEKAEAYKINLCYHHHVGTGIQMDKEIRQLMKETEKFPQSFSLLLDTGHLYYAEEMARRGSGQTVLNELVKNFAGRIKHVHLKNIRQEILMKAQEQGWSFLRAMQEGVFTVPGDEKEGVIQFDQVFKHLADKDFSGWLIVEAEQDPRRPNTASPLEYAQIAHKFVMDKIKQYSPASVGGRR